MFKRFGHWIWGHGVVSVLVASAMTTIGTHRRINQKINRSTYIIAYLDLLRSFMFWPLGGLSSFLSSVLYRVCFCQR